MTGDFFFFFCQWDGDSETRGLNGVFKLANRSISSDGTCLLSGLLPTFKQVSRHPQSRAREKSSAL